MYLYPPPFEHLRFKNSFHLLAKNSGEVAETKGGALENLVSDRRSTALTLLSLGGERRRVLPRFSAGSLGRKMARGNGKMEHLLNFKCFF